MSNVRQMLAFVRTFDMIYMANVVLNSYVIFILCIHKNGTETFSWILSRLRHSNFLLCDRLLIPLVFFPLRSGNYNR